MQSEARKQLLKGSTGWLINPGYHLWGEGRPCAANQQHLLTESMLGCRISRQVEHPKGAAACVHNTSSTQQLMLRISKYAVMFASSEAQKGCAGKRAHLEHVKNFARDLVSGDRCILGLVHCTMGFVVDCTTIPPYAVWSLIRRWPIHNCASRHVCRV